MTYSRDHLFQLTVSERMALAREAKYSLHGLGSRGSGDFSGRIFFFSGSAWTYCNERMGGLPAECQGRLLRAQRTMNTFGGQLAALHTV